MKRYLLFDSGCSVCNSVAQLVEAASDGKLEARSLNDSAMQGLIDAAGAPHMWVPTLIEQQDNGRIAVSTGLTMRVRLIKALGPRRAWRVGRVVVDQIVTKQGEATDWQRRRLLTTGAVGAAAVVLGLPMLQPRNATASSGSRGEPGAASHGIGVRDIQVEAAGDSLDVTFRHIIPERSGMVRIIGLEAERTSVELRRGKPVLTLTLDRPDNAFTTDVNGGPHARIAFVDGALAAEPANAREILAPYEADMAIASAIAGDLTPARPMPSPADSPESVATASCPCACCGNYTEGNSHGPHWQRSAACEDAYNDLQYHCSNSWCWGCCRTLASCDCICFSGDFMCNCSRLGYRCTGRCT